MIYICIPALNEARTIGVLLWKIRQVMEEFPRDYHVLVLDDGSTDDTREVLEPYARVLPVTVLRNEKTQGYAPALEKLIREAVRLSTHPKRDGLIVMQADFTESPDDIPQLLKRLEGGADIVGTAVKETEGELPRSLRWSRRGLPWLVSRSPRPKEIRDPLSGFRAYRVSVLKRALQDRDGKPLLTKHGWAANAELLLCVTPHVRRAEDAEVSLHYTRRERPTRFRPWSTALELWDFARKAPRRLAEARAAAAASDAKQPPQKPPRPEPAAADATRVQPPRREPAPEAPRQPRPQRAPESTAPAAPSTERTRPPRKRNRGRKDGDRQPQGDAQQPRAQGDAEPQRQRPPAAEAPEPRRREPSSGDPQRSPSPDAEQPFAGTLGDSEPQGDGSPESEGQPQGDGPRKRRSRSRRGKKPAASMDADASPDASASAAASPAAEAAAGTDQPDAALPGEASDAPPKRKRPPRPRRPRRKPQGAEGGESPESGGGESGPGDASPADFDAGRSSGGESGVSGGGAHRVESGAGDRGEGSFDAGPSSSGGGPTGGDSPPRATGGNESGTMGGGGDEA
ncbi:glycosyltransferase [Longimicrobium sp.]|uniref:glycosyltransferase n=1 Tax=Longimicrobium sp. TaxID=2029185 RepID=UPI002C7EC8F0|nr:glycosyltransferase [Longimicrobium sp.]HSU16393.1 glycosyltransferase [Longimicrobium sp.]